MLGVAEDENVLVLRIADAVIVNLLIFILCGKFFALLRRVVTAVEEPVAIP